jgi:hypothetical protein
MGDGIALLSVGIIFAAVAAWRLYSGRSYISHPVAQVARRNDPFSFWLSEGILILVALVLIVRGVAKLLE